MTTAAMKKIGQLSQHRLLDVMNGAVFQRTAAQKVLYVDSNTGSDSATRSGEDIRSPFATIDYAIGKCTADAMDVILVLPMHAETVTASITMDLAGVSIIGLKQGNRRPVITPNGVINAVTVTAANCKFGGFRFAAPSTDAQTSDINIAGKYTHIFDTVHIGSTTGSKNKVNVIVLNTGGDYSLVEDVRIFNPSTEVPAAIKIAAAIAGVEIRNCAVFDAVGYTNGAIYDAAAATDIHIHDCMFKNYKAATAACNMVANSTGIMNNVYISGRHTTIASNHVTSNAMSYFKCYVTEEAALNGILMPAADA